MTLPELRFEDAQRVAEWLEHSADHVTEVELAAVLVNVLHRIARVEAKLKYLTNMANRQI